MKKCSCILFDLDGTLINTFEGILNSYQYAARKMNLPLPTKEFVSEVIGAPLAQVFAEKFNLDESDVKKAISYYREEYARNGICQGKVYPEIKELLRYLCDEKFKLGVTTLKNEKFARIMLEEFEIAKYMDVILGMDGEDKQTKAMLISRALEVLGVCKEEAVLVGDSFYDGEGAQEAGIGFIGVTYGFGFKNQSEVWQYREAISVDTPMEIKGVVFNQANVEN